MLPKSAFMYFWNIVVVKCMTGESGKMVKQVWYKLQRDDIMELERMETVSTIHILFVLDVNNVLCHMYNVIQ